MERKQQLIQDIENLLNQHDTTFTTSINPDLLAFMDESSLLNIIDSLLTQKEQEKEIDMEWLEKFKQNKT